MTALSITFKRGPFKGWAYDLIDGGSGVRILAQVETRVLGNPGLDRLTGVITLTPESEAVWNAAQEALREGGHVALEKSLRVLLANADELVTAAAAQEQAVLRWKDIVTAGEVSAQLWTKHYPNGVPPFEVVGKLSVPVD